MPRADKYIAGLFPPNANRTTVRAKVLTPLEAVNLSTALRADAVDLYYSGWVSFLDALNGIKKGFYTWSTVKLYYSAFYAFRASLAVDDVCTFHVSRPHYIVVAQPGQLPVSCSEPGTHKVVLKTFQQRNPIHTLTSQQIELKDAVDWLIAKRESANYGDPRFSEPDSRREFDFIAASGIRKTLNAYLTEGSSLYVFDPDHAIVAYPLRALQLIGDQLLAAIPAGGVAVDEQQFLKACARDNSGYLSQLISEMKRLTLVL
jgi:hypothetical protein